MTAKKILPVGKEYFEDKLKKLQEQQQKVVNVLNQYSKLYDKLEGALDITQEMLNDFKEPVENDKPNESDSGS
jgi:hypothetical protein